MKVNLSQKLNTVFTTVKEFYFPKRVCVAKYYTDGKPEDALRRLDKVKDVFVPYAKDKGVSLYVDKGTSLLEEGSNIKVTPEYKQKLENSIVMRVTNNMNFKEKHMLIDATTDSFQFIGSKYVTAGAGGAVVKKMVARSDIEDNLIRRSFRVFESLAEMVTR